MEAKRGHVVRFHYALSGQDGKEVESSRGGDPVLALLGHGNLMLGLEEAIIGHQAGESFSASLDPDQAFGERREDWTQRVSKKHFGKGARFQAGAQRLVARHEGSLRRFLSATDHAFAAQLELEITNL